MSTLKIPKTGTAMLVFYANILVHVIFGSSIVRSTVYSSSLPASPLPALRSHFCANDSLVGLELECGELWKTCLRMGRLLHNRSGRCYPLGATAPCGGNGSLVLDARALREGALYGVCQGNDTCDGYSMAYDGRCYDAATVNDSLCGGGAVIARHLLGGWECWCGGGGAAAIEQPEAPGRCALPPFPAQGAEPFRVACSPAVRRCLGQGALPFEGACYEPLSNATCAEGEWLTLNESAAEAGVLSATCAPRRPCGEQAQRLRATGRCYSEQQLRETLCPGDSLFYAPTGDVVCSQDAHGSDAGVRIVAECDGKELFSIDIRKLEIGAEEKSIFEIIILVQSMFHIAFSNNPGVGEDCPRDDDGNCEPGVHFSEECGNSC